MSRPACLLLPCVLVLAACGGPARHGVASALDAAVDDGSYDEARRLYLVLAPDDPRRIEVRDRLTGFLAARTEALLGSGDYDAVVRHFSEMVSLLAPADFAPPGSLPAALAPVARWIVEHGSRRGDESRVMAALLVLSRLSPPGTAELEEYGEVAAWGREARWGAAPRLTPTFLEVGPELIAIWEEHARLSPAPEVLSALADLYVALRDLATGPTLEQAFAPPGEPGGSVSMSELRMAAMIAERVPLDVAAVYLRVGDLAGAASRVAALGDRGGIEWRLRRLIEQASTDAELLGELAGGYERARPDVSLALCRLGRRLHPADARFPLCLARGTAEDGERVAEATAWYAEAVDLAPDDREVYDEAIGRLAQLLDGGLFDAETGIGRARTVARHAERILAQREARWPGEPAAVTLAELRRQLARAEMRAGHLDEAAAELEASVEAGQGREALVDLGVLRMRRGDAAGAVALFREAIDRIHQQGPAVSLDRAGLLEHLADAQRVAGDAEAARHTYAEALALLRPFAAEGDESQRALMRVRMGVLERRAAAGGGETDFRAAMEAAPTWREPYAEILAHLVVTEPAPGLAEEVFRRARTGASLEREWRVYFALWVQIVAARGSAPASAEVRQTLDEQASSPDWHGRLAAFGAGTLEESALVSAAQGPGQRCEAHFYAGARKLAQGDTSGARQEFRAALDTGMVSYFEYAMAQELLAGLPQ